jgi:3-hydroxyisobutyrate dehydrogenase-like beta-hydroxyacid dehydrogenase
MSKKIGIIGLGRVGLPAAKAYISAGYQVYGYDKLPEVKITFEKLGGIHLESAGMVAEKSDIILIMVLNDEQVIDVISGYQGLLKKATGDTVIVCMSTINRVNLESQAKSCQEKEIGFLDCPFTGGPARVPAGNLTLIAAGPDNLVTRVKPHLEVIGNIIHAGKNPGMGQAVKHCNQLLVGVTHAATMEVFTLANKLGLDASLVSKVIASGIAGSDYFRLLSDSILKKNPSPGGLGQMCKDVAIVVNTTKEVKMPAYTASGASKYFAMAEARGMQDREGADLIEIVESTIDGKND